jgi:ribosomal protein S18 acetylase RimI-like enzyme
MPKLTVARACAGQGLGGELLDWAGTRAAAAGDRWLRVDVWTTNLELQGYYRRLGFTHVRTVALAHNPSGALFQRRARHVAPRDCLKPIEALRRGTNDPQHLHGSP